MHEPTIESLPSDEQAELQRYAQARAAMAQRASIPVSSTYARDARELVDDAHADTWSGDLPRDPQRGPLLQHLKNAIKRRTWLEIRHAPPGPFVPLQETANDEYLEPAVGHEPRSRSIQLHAITTRLVQELRAFVGRDVDSRALLTSWAEGYLEKDEIVRRAGLSDLAYECARRRLGRLARSLTPELCETARDLLNRAA